MCQVLSCGLRTQQGAEQSESLPLWSSCCSVWGGGGVTNKTYINNVRADKCYTEK